MKKDFCEFCGAGIPPKDGEGTCHKCDPEHIRNPHKFWKNKAQCMKCLDIIESKYTHDFVSCKCGDIFVDGGNSYWRCQYTNENSFRRIYEEKNK